LRKLFKSIYVINDRDERGSKKMRDMKDIYMKDLSKYSEWLDEDILSSFTKNAEYLIEKHGFYNVTLRHKKLNEKESFDYEVKIRTHGLDVSKVPSTLQKNRIIEDAGIAMGLLFTQLLRPFKFFNVLKIGEGYDISVSCFPDRLQIYWGHKNDESG
jgi:hypothetical protein